jgi:hypothetical protein
VPGQSGTGARSMVAWSCVEATKVIQIGKAMTSSPRITTMWLSQVRKGRFSTM